MQQETGRRLEDAEDSVAESSSRKGVQEDPVDVYLQRIGDVPLLTVEEEKRLAQYLPVARQKNSPKELVVDPEGVRDYVIRANLRLVVSIARKYIGRGLGLSDLIEEGNLGLIIAVDRFDPDYNVRIGTYATWWIKQTIRRALRRSVKTIRIPEYLSSLVSAWHRSRRVLEEELGRAPRDEEMATHMDISGKELKKVKQALHLHSSFVSSISMSQQETMNSAESLADPRTSRDETEKKDDVERMHAALKKIPRRQQQVLRLRFGLDCEEKTLKQIGIMLGVTRERIRQIEAEGLKELRRQMEREEELTLA